MISETVVPDLGTAGKAKQLVEFGCFGIFVFLCAVKYFELCCFHFICLFINLQCLACMVIISVFISTQSINRDITSNY